MKWKHLCFLILVCAFTASRAKAEAFIGTDVYKQVSDSPFAGFDPTFGTLIVEDFEDDSFHAAIDFTNTGGSISPSSDPLTDSVDADVDGVNDNSAGRSFLEGDGSIEIHFDPANFGGVLPTHVGLVVTDWTPVIPLTGVTLYGATSKANQNAGIFAEIVSGGRADMDSNGRIGGDTGTFPGALEDVFLGLSDPDGIKLIVLLNDAGTGPGRGIEIDHLQFGYFPAASAVPEPSSWVLFGCVGCLVAGRIRRRRA